MPACSNCQAVNSKKARAVLIGAFGKSCIQELADFQKWACLMIDGLPGVLLCSLLLTRTFRSKVAIVRHLLIGCYLGAGAVTDWLSFRTGA